jgi:hypothetical protein
MAIAGLVTVFLFFMFRTVTTISDISEDDGGSAIDMPESDTAFAGIFYTPRFNDSLPHYLYRRMEDSAKRAKTESERENRSVSAAGISMALFGVYSMDIPKVHTSKEQWMKELVDKMDQATVAAGDKIKSTANKDSIEKIKTRLRDSLAYYKRYYEKRITIAEKYKEKYYYVAFDGYKLDEHSKFFIQNETYNLAYVKWDTARKNTNSNWQHGHYERKEIPVRYSAENERVLVPVSQHQYQALQALVYVLMFVLLVSGLYFFIGIPVQVLLNISRGQAFDENNVRYFNIIARLFFVLGLLYLFGPYIMDLFLRSIIPADFKRPPLRDGLGKICWLFVLSIAVYITGKAFQKGNTLQKEQDLTI